MITSFVGKQIHIYVFVYIDISEQCMLIYMFTNISTKVRIRKPSYTIVISNLTMAPNNFQVEGLQLS